ncbi:hypothetical protein [uncultured Arthrobacter sp.]|uniref:hypothetical protein n=1 Tax=uncultured Arthrobacter sp. TaxID=114050 RepID=UPI0026074169|nr:hypothetical protein [uncultured Arthrobacter sp.]
MTGPESTAALYPHFIGMVLGLGLADLDAAALRGARPRELTQAVATWIYETTDLHGVTFASRYGDDLQLWAVFERPGDGLLSSQLRNIQVEELHPESDIIEHAFRMLDLSCKSE